MKLYTIGFTKKSAEQFFTLLQQHGVKRMIDIRLHATSQLAGFSKQDDLVYFLDQIVHCAYTHLPLLAPEAEMLAQYRQDRDWPQYAQHFERLLDERAVPAVLDPALFDNACLLCSEATPEQCHRRLVAERLQRAWSNLEILHLV